MKQQAFEVDQRGMTLRGTSYLPDRAGRHPAVLLLHGFAGQRIEAGFMFVQIARALTEAGIAAVAFDFRHCGESDGRFEQMLVTGKVEDALRMTRWLQGQPFADRSRLGVLGYSLGGLVAACLCGRSNAYRTLTLIAPTTVENMARHAGEKTPGELVTVGPHALHPQFFDDMRTLDPLTDCMRHPRPTLIVQGTEDKAVPPDISGQYVQTMRQAGITVTMEEVAGADHSFSKPQPRQTLLRAITQWHGEQLQQN